MMKTAFLISTLCGLLSNSYHKEYGCSDLIYKNGYTYEVESGNLANGELECVEYLDCAYAEYLSYKDGIKVKWIYLLDNDTIEKGKTIISSKLTTLLSQKFNAKDISLKVSQVGDTGHVDFLIYEPEKVLDSVQIEKIICSDLRNFMFDNQLNRVNMYTLNKEGYWKDDDSFRLKK